MNSSHEPLIPFPVKKLRKGCVVIQLGARLHYATPAAIERAGALRSLYTDFCVLPGEARSLRLLPQALIPKSVRRLLGRVLPDNIWRSKLHRYGWSTFRDWWFIRKYPQLVKNSQAWLDHCVGANYFTKHLIENDFDGAGALYTHPCVAYPAIRAAKEKGISVIYESISHPFDQQIEGEENDRFGAERRFDRTLMETNWNFFRKELELATIVLAASNYSRQGLIDFGVAAERIRVVPYGLPHKFFDSEPEPVPGRVLFVGSVGYRKGLPYLAEAARILKKSHPEIEIRVAGPFEIDISGRPEFAGPTYLGQVPRIQVKEEFLKADLFAFPTVSDAFGIVLMEALQAGLPIVSTSNCADAVEEGRNGFRIPVRDAAALADRIVQIVRNRDLRHEMGAESLKLADQFTAEAYSARLGAVLAELESL